jgi:hypothetical protein
MRLRNAGKKIILLYQHTVIEMNTDTEQFRGASGVEPPLLPGVGAT